jgi:hypothetical protein
MIWLTSTTRISVATDSMSVRIGGKIEKLLPEESPTYGFIRGDDGRQYFFIPSGLTRLSDITFPQLCVHHRVDFVPFEHPSRGMRAKDVRIVRA